MPDLTAAERAREVLKPVMLARFEPYIDPSAVRVIAGDATTLLLDALLAHPDLLAALAVEAGGKDDGNERQPTSDLAEVFREALMREHHNDWDMETVAEGAHICARQMEQVGWLTGGAFTRDQPDPQSLAVYRRVEGERE